MTKAGSFRVAAAWGILCLFVGGTCAGERGEVLFRTLAVTEKLERPMSCDFQGWPLSEAIQFFRKTLDLNIVLDASARKFEESPVTLSVRNVPARTALQWTLRQVGLRFALAEGAVYVAAPAEALRVEPTYLRQYDVNDLLVSFAAIGRTSRSSDGAATSSDYDGRRGRALYASDDLLTLIIAFTGRENWDYVQILGVSREISDETKSREDRF